MYEKIVLICVPGMVGGDRNLFVRKGGASQKRLGNTDLDKRSFNSKRHHLLANERSAVATREHAAQFTVVLWRFFSLEKREVFSSCSGCFLISTFIWRTTDLEKIANKLAYIEEKQTQGIKKSQYDAQFRYNFVKIYEIL